MKLRFHCWALMALTGCGAEPGGLDETAATTAERVTGPTWTQLTNAAPQYLNTCLLLTDGRVMCQEYFSNQWDTLTPDANGSYVNGTWTLGGTAGGIALMPNANDATIGCANCTYGPLYYASAVLPDGRVVVVGGEYNVGFGFVKTNIGFVYDPVTNIWSGQLTEAFGSGQVGDASGIVLEDGTFLLAEGKPNAASTPGNVESLDLTTTPPSFTALAPPGKKAGASNNEENWNILYDGTFLTVNSFLSTSSEIYDPDGNQWLDGGSTIVDLADETNSKEVGPGVLRPDGTLVAFSGNPAGQNAVYDTATQTWSHPTGIDFPVIEGGQNASVPDGPATLLPNGNVLVMASPMSAATTFQIPSHFYEIDLATNQLTAVVDSPNAAAFTSYQGRFLLLPTGEVLMTAYNQGTDQITTVPQVQDVLIYSNGGLPLDAWRPTITTAPTGVVAGNSYAISGTLFNGFSEGATYGDDATMSTNYPLVRITNTATGHVRYARTHGHSRMGVEPVGSTEIVSTQFDVPPNIEVGPSSLVVVVNGIASQPVNVNINRPPVAQCQDFALEAGSGCTASVTTANINNSSFDPDGDTITCVLSSTGPFSVGATTVTLTCTDPSGAQGGCTATVRVGVGNNQNCCPAGMNRIVGTSNNDTINGTSGADCILGLGAQDTISGNGGDDIISGGDGDDVLNGNSGNDIITGGSGQDRLNGNAGNDSLAGGDGDDQCFGGDGDDKLFGGQGQDRLFGENNNDSLSGNTGTDRLEGGAGDDLLDGSGPSGDTCIGGTGTDVFVVCQNQTQ